VLEERTPIRHIDASGAHLEIVRVVVQEAHE
jgi:hypothetical protein